MFVEFFSPINLGRFSPYPSGDYLINSTRHNLANLLNYGILLPFFLLGIVLLIIRKRREVWLLLIPILFHTTFHVFSWARERYRFVIDTLIIMLAMYAVIWLYQKIVKSIKI